MKDWTFEKCFDRINFVYRWLSCNNVSGFAGWAIYWEVHVFCYRLFNLLYLFHDADLIEQFRSNVIGTHVFSDCYQTGIHHMCNVSNLIQYKSSHTSFSISVFTDISIRSINCMIN